MDTLKFENIAGIDDIIRAYDFQPMEGRPTRYVEGIVEGIVDNIGYRAFKIFCTFDTEDYRQGKTVFVPLEVSFSEFDARVSKVI